MAIHVLVGAAIGAVLGGGASALTSVLRGKPIDWKSVGAAALGGAAAGAITSLTFGGSLLAGSAVAKVGGMTLAGAAGGFSEQAADNVLHEREWTEGVARSTAEGAAIGAAAGVVRVAARPVARMVAGNPALKREVARRAGRALARPLRQAWTRYRAALVRAPRKTQAATSAAITALGDGIGQATEDGRSEWDWKRTAYRTAFSAAWSGTIGWTWLNRLEKWFPGAGWSPMLKRLALDQAVMTPIWSAPFFGGYGVLVDGKSPRDAAGRILPATGETYGLNLAFAPLTAANWRFAPLELRPVIGNLLGLAYSVIMARSLTREAPTPPGRVDLPLGEDGPVGPGPRRGAQPAGAEAGPGTGLLAHLDRMAERGLDGAEERLVATSEGLIDALAGVGR